MTATLNSLTDVGAPHGPVRLLAGVAGRTGPFSTAEHAALHGELPRWAPARGRAPGALVPEIEASGLRGRGGGWFPTGRKWRAVAHSAAKARTRPVVLANGMEGEPASGKDAVLLRFVPHLVLDGLVLAAEAIGADRAVIAVHRGSPVEEVLERAIAQRPGDGVRVRIVTPPARYVSSEESALSHFVGDGIALPTFGPRPYVRGAGGRPTLVQNVETLANVALIARHGAGWFGSEGDTSAPGTTMVTVSGSVAFPGVVEVPTGTAVADVLAACGGAVGRIGALLTGGYGGAWLGPEGALLPWSPDPVRDAGGVVGAGVLVVLPSDSCVLAETARVSRWLAGESAGQCGPCRFGLPAIADDVGALVRGTATATDVDRLMTRLGLVTGRGSCRHPDGAARLVESALRVAGDDIAAHARGRCVSGGDRRILPVPTPGPVPVPTPGREWR